MGNSTLEDVDAHLRAIISNLYMLIVQAHEYRGQATGEAMTAEIKQLVHNLVTLSESAARLPTHIPLDVIQYVENSRNPDIYTREFVELVMRYNQQIRGKSVAFAAFRDALGQQMVAGIPEMAEDVRRVVAASGGSVDG